MKKKEFDLKKSIVRTTILFVLFAILNVFLMKLVPKISLGQANIEILRVSTERLVLLFQSS